MSTDSAGAASEIIEAVDACPDIATSIKRVADAAQSLRATGLTRKALVVLLHHDTKISQKNINLLLDAMEDLKLWTLYDG